MKSVQLVDLLNDLEKEEEINKRVKEHLKNTNDDFLLFYPDPMSSGRFPSSNPVSTIYFTREQHFKREVR